MANEDKSKPKYAGPLAKLDVVEQGELELGYSFHAFRFSAGGTVEDSLRDIKLLEEKEVGVGLSFHAFRFQSAELRELDEVEKEELQLGGAFHAFRFG